MPSCLRINALTKVDIPTFIVLPSLNVTDMVTYSMPFSVQKPNAYKRTKNMRNLVGNLTHKHYIPIYIRERTVAHIPKYYECFSKHWKCVKGSPLYEKKSGRKATEQKVSACRRCCLVEIVLHSRAFVL